MNKILIKDIHDFAKDFSQWEELHSKTFLITGSTGLIGSTLCHCLNELNRQHELKIRIFCPVRSIEKFNSIYGNNRNIVAITEDLQSFLWKKSEHIDYIIHCASPTGSNYMASNPVETYTYIVESTLLILKYAYNKAIESMVYVSSLEYYGQFSTNEIITEDKIGYVDPSSPRSSYPLGKRSAEFACVSYAKEYGVPVKIARLTQTFGAGISKSENRVFAQFAKAAIKGNDIVLRSSGKSSKPYCYTTDAVNGILTLLLKGNNGEAYNVSNDETYISINNMAYLVKDNFNNKINIIHDIDLNSNYAPDTLLNLTSKKLQNLGWKPKYNLLEMYKRLINYLIS